MGFLEKLNQINNHLEKIKQINRNVSTHSKFSSLESDLVKDHLRNLYDLYNELENIKPQPAIVNSVPPVKSEVVKAVKETTNNQIVKEVEAPKVEVSEPVPKAEPEIIVEAPNTTVDSIETNVVEEVEIEAAAPQNLKVDEIFDKKESISLFEKYQDNSGKGEVNKISNATRPLKKLISLNDKFILIKELFGSSVLKYDAAIAKIDSLPSKDEALAFLKSNVWNTPDLQAKDDVIERVEAILDLKFLD